MWQYPPSNWGKSDYWQGLGHDLSGFKRLSFWARADQECSMEFHFGGVDEKYGDSARTGTRRVCRITPHWTEFSLPLEGDVSHIVTGFGWTSSWDTTPKGTVFYLDDIRFTNDAETGVAQSAPTAPQVAPHEKYVTAAWAALDKGDFQEALAQADKCIEQFQDAAVELQATLADEQIPVGAVSEATQKKIFANGVLNDVATAHFIRGAAAKALGQKETAIEAYRAALKLPQARCWDRAFFWSPAEGAARELRNLGAPR
jgi:hypothetical protein